MNLYFMNGIYKLPQGETRRIVAVMRSFCPSVSFGLDPAMILHSDAKKLALFQTQRERKSSQMNSGGFKEIVHQKHIILSSFIHYFNPKPSDWTDFGKTEKETLDEHLRCAFPYSGSEWEPGLSSSKND